MKKVEKYICPKCGMEYLGLTPTKYEFVCSRCNRHWTIIEGHNKLSRINLKINPKRFDND